jgi:hypothetical protein
VDEAVTDNDRGFEAQKELTQGSLCYFDGITNFEGRHGTKPLVVDSSRQQDLRRLVVVVRGRTKTDYRTSFNAVNQRCAVRPRQSTSTAVGPCRQSRTPRRRPRRSLMITLLARAVPLLVVLITRETATTAHSKHQANQIKIGVGHKHLGVLTTVLTCLLRFDFWPNFSMHSWH